MKTQEVKFQLNASGVYKPSVLTQAISMKGNSVKVNVPLWGGRSWKWVAQWEGLFHHHTNGTLSDNPGH